MKRKSIPLLLLISILLFACSHNSDPKEVVDSFFVKMKEKDFKGAFNLTTDSSHSLLQNIIDTVSLWKENNAKLKQPIAKESLFTKRPPLRIETDSVTIKDNHATVSVLYKRGNKLIGDLLLPLVKKGCRWKIDFVSPQTKMTLQPSDWIEDPGFALGL